MTMENIEKVIVTKSQVSGDGPRFLTDSDTKRVTIAGFLELYKNQGSLVIGNDEIVYLFTQLFNLISVIIIIAAIILTILSHLILMTKFRQCLMTRFLIIY